MAIADLFSPPVPVGPGLPITYGLANEDVAGTAVAQRTEARSLKTSELVAVESCATSSRRGSAWATGSRPRPRCSRSTA